MDYFLDFEECIRDSPVFRLSLERCENDLEESESRMEKVMRLCNKMVDDGQVFCSSNQLFLSALAELTSHHKNNTAIEHFEDSDKILMNLVDFVKISVSRSASQRPGQDLVESVSVSSVKISISVISVSRSASLRLGQNLGESVTVAQDLVESFKILCVRIRDELNTALVKNAQVSQHKAAEAERHTHLLLATRKCYTHCSLDYCLQLNNFLTQQKLDMLNSVFSFFHAQNTFFHQGFDLLKDLEPTMKIMAAELSGLSAECVNIKKNLEHQHLLVQQRGSLVACEFLLQNGASANHRDQHGHAAIHTATTRGHTG
ncbi:Arf-GAP with coiled-coil, ANK repeat and PH domain-containing protein 2 [Bagarius yarrelli]|uniref:Arf-GAP with coiled-coil, ANK repeat and PH domain-containing protein n=1 Tax=Bagarius yarrelli TaxID=175774 RepID=A0A556V795_BAGYA|nr:Arf-GAP with coiled-coil, ANK repeat and PH domain-containing protein 2 [Bagarius yarrelli]